MHKIGSGSALSFAPFRKEKLKLPAESGGAAYRIRTYDPRITKEVVSTQKYEENNRFGMYPAGQTRFTKWVPKLA